MRYLVMFLMVLSLGMFAIGCAKEEEKKPETKPPAEKKETPPDTTPPADPGETP